MAITGIEPGTTLSGLLFAGDADAPLVAATIRLNPDLGIEVEVPFLSNRPEFDGLREWFRGAPNSLPRNMTFLSGLGQLSLFDNRWSYYSPAPIDIGRFVARDVVFKEREAGLDGPLRVTELMSEIDGLASWTNYRATEWDTELNDEQRIRAISARVESKDEFSWSVEGVTFTIRVNWRGDDQGRPGLHVDEWVAVTTKFDEPQPVRKHLDAQERLVALLTLTFGAPVYFRQHSIRSEDFIDKVMGRPKPGEPDRESLGSSFYPLVSSRTVHEVTKAKPKDIDLRTEGLVFLPQLTPDGLSKWFGSYDAWSRMIDPTVGLLFRDTVSPFDVVVSANLSLESAGHLLPSRQPETNESKDAAVATGTCKKPRNPTTSSLVERCLDELNFDWSPVAETTHGLAQAIADNYNTIKHFNRGVLPPLSETRMLGGISVLVVRLLGVNLVDPSGERVSEFGSGWTFSGYLQNFVDVGLYVNASGKFVEQPIQISSAEDE